MKLINEEYSQLKTKVLKRSMTGQEAEFHMLDNKGKVSDRAHEVIQELLSKYPDMPVTKEIGQNMIEFGCYPDIKTYNPALNMIDSIQKAQQVCVEKGLTLFPFATYPGKFEPKIQEGEGYLIKQKIFGEDKVKVTCRVTGYHNHYTLPKGVFDDKKKEIRMLKKSKLKRTMVSSYNFEIAADPALTLFTQCSPFYEGQNLAKDSRMLVYRGGKKLKYMDGVYSRLQQIGGLPPYKQTGTDIFSSLNKRWERWEREVKRVSPQTDFDKLYPHKLDIGWNPVKLNKHGTLEQRGMDVNFLSILIGVGVLLKFSLKTIQREFVEVLPADFAIEEAFKIENGMLYIPPHSYVRNKLQYWSAYKGYGNKEMYNYAKRFFN
ncbi:MAG: hypothetical protein KJ922_00820, partial [Nanoarchaeota archaeon]|nr:hypothetical protein [Nanoarchaeota archaeon]